MCCWCLCYPTVSQIYLPGLPIVVLLFLPHSLGQVCLVLGTSTAQSWEWQQTCLSLCCNLPLLSPGSVPTAQYSCLFHTYLDISKATEPGGEQAPGREEEDTVPWLTFFSFCPLSPHILQVGRSELGLYFPFPCNWISSSEGRRTGGRLSLSSIAYTPLVPTPAQNSC